MKLEILAPELSLAELCEAVELFAEYLGLKARFDGNDTICCNTVTVTLETAPGKPLIMVHTTHTKPDSSAVRALEQILPYAPPGSRLDYNGHYSAIRASGA